MLIGKFQIHKPAPLMLFAMMVGFSVLVPASAAAAETFLRKPALDDYVDGDVTVARMGQRGPAVHMSVISPAEVHHGEAVNASALRQTTSIPNVYLSVRLPW